MAESCAIVARTSAIVGERWIWVILRQAFNGARRFEEFQRGIRLARNVLAERLDRLVEDGIFRRESYAPGAARELNEYRLTAKGVALFPAYTALMEWGNEWTGLPAPPVELLHKPCRQRTRVRVVCSQCGEDIDAQIRRLRQILTLMAPETGSVALGSSRRPTSHVPITERVRLLTEYRR